MAVPTSIGIVNDGRSHRWPLEVATYVPDFRPSSSSFVRIANTACRCHRPPRLVGCPSSPGVRRSSNNPTRHRGACGFQPASPAHMDLRPDVHSTSPEHPGPAVKRVVTPKVVKRACRALHPIDNGVYGVQRSVATSLRSGRTARAPVWHHGNCPINHRCADTAKRCPIRERSVRRN